MTGIFQNIMLLIGGGIALLLVPLGALLVGVGLFALQRRGASGSWPQVPATIETSEVRPDSLGDSPMFKPLVRYRFAAPGGTFTADKLATTGRLYPKQAAAQKVVDRYPVGTTVMARYNPADPAEAILEREGFGGIWFVLLGLLCWVFPAVGAVAVGISWPLVATVLGCMALLITLLLLRGKSGLAAARASGRYPPAGMGGDADVAALMKRGEKLLAIRLYRELHGCGLKEAKEGVEALPRDAESPAP